jgi:hypothetical protein
MTGRPRAGSHQARTLTTFQTMKSLNLIFAALTIPAALSSETLLSVTLEKETVEGLGISSTTVTQHLFAEAAPSPLTLPAPNRSSASMVRTGEADGLEDADIGRSTIHGISCERGMMFHRKSASVGEREIFSGLRRGERI